MKGASTLFLLRWKMEDHRRSKSSCSFRFLRGDSCKILPRKQLTEGRRSPKTKDFNGTPCKLAFLFSLSNVLIKVQKCGFFLVLCSCYLRFTVSFDFFERSEGGRRPTSRSKLIFLFMNVRCEFWLGEDTF